MRKGFNILLALLALGASGSEYLSDEEPSVEALMENDGVEVKKLDDIPANKIKDVPPRVIREVPAEVIKALPVERLREIPVDVLKSVPVEVLASVPVDVLKSVPVEVLASVPVDVLKRVPVEVLASVPVDVLKSVPVEVLASVPVDVLKSVPVEVLASVPVDVLKSVPVEVLASVPVDVLKSVSVEVLKSIPVEAIREVAAKHLPDAREMREIVAFYARLNQFFPDTDNIQWHRMSDQVKSDLAAWAEIYKAYAANRPEPAAKIELASGLRMISYMRLPKTEGERKTLEKNLSYYKEQGYNAVLFLAEDLDHLAETVALIRAVRADHGLGVWAAYGPDGEGWNAPATFLNPEKYSSWLAALAPELDGWLLGYKRTSCHLFMQDAPYIHTVVTALRKGNPDLPVVGELYYGYTYRLRSEHTAYYSSNTFSNASADIVQNRGHLNLDRKTVMKRLDKPGIGVVVGRKPMYLTTTRDSWSYARKIKERIERDFLRAGALGTITEHGDGVSEIRSFGVSILYNDLSKTLYSDLNSIGKQ